jgi:hypothetical protein
MRSAVVVMMLLGSFSICLGCAGAGETEDTTEKVGADAAEWFWTGPPPTGIIADAVADAVASEKPNSGTDGKRLILQAALEAAKRAEASR